MSPPAPLGTEATPATATQLAGRQAFNSDSRPATFDFFSSRRVHGTPLTLQTRWHPRGLVSLLGQQLHHPSIPNGLQPLAFDFRPHSRIEHFYPRDLQEPMAAVRGVNIWGRYLRNATFLLCTRDPAGVLALINRPPVPREVQRDSHVWRAPPVIFGPQARPEWLTTYVSDPPPCRRLDRWRDSLAEFPGLILCNELYASCATVPRRPST